MVNEITTSAQGTASGMNVLIQGVESLLSKLFAGKSPLVLHGITGTQVEEGAQHPYGRFFYFKNGSTFRYLGAATNYVQSIYQDKVNSWVTSFVDTEAGNVALIPSEVASDFHGENQSILHQSLKPMTRQYAGVDYRVVSDIPAFGSHERFERVRWYEVAELVFEGHAEYTWDAEWTKYRFLRVHNLSDYPMTFNIGIHSYSIAAFGVKTIRWNTDNTVSTGNYLWYLQNGDPRLHMVGDNRMTANTVCNPQIMLWWLAYHTKNFSQAFTGGGVSPIYANGAESGVGFTLNYHALPDVYGYTSIFGRPEQDTTLLGDLYHHAGDLVVMRKPSGGEWSATTMRFNGYSSIVSDFAAVGVSAAEVDGVYTLSPAVAGDQIDLFAVGTNLLDVGRETVWAVSLPYTLEGSWAVRGFEAGGWQQTTRKVIGGRFDPRPGSPLPDEYQEGADWEIQLPGDINEYWAQTISYPVDWLDSGAWQEIECNALTTIQQLEGLFADKGYSINQAIRLTPLGFAVEWTRARENDTAGLYSATSRAEAFEPQQANSGTDIESNEFRGLAFIGAESLSPVSLYYNHAIAYPRNYLKLSQDIDTEFGESIDQTATWEGLSSVTASEIKRLITLPIDGGTLGSPWRTFHGLEETVTLFLANKNDSDWYEANRASVIANNGNKTTWARPALAVEDYNRIAGYVNAIQYVTPISVSDVYQELRLFVNADGIPRTESAGVHFQILGAADIIPLVHYPWDSGNLYPLGFWRSLNPASLTYSQEVAFCLANGIPIRTVDDLPESYATVRDATTNLKYWSSKLWETDYSYYVLGTPPGWWDEGTMGPYYEPGSNDRTYDAEFTLSSSSGAVEVPQVYRIDYTRPYEWIKAEDVKAFAESKGLPFYHVLSGSPVRLVIVDLPDPVLSENGSIVLTGLDIADIRPRQAPGSGVDQGPHEVSSGSLTTTPKHAILERVNSSEDAEYLLYHNPGERPNTVRNITEGHNNLEPLQNWANLGEGYTYPVVVGGWIKPTYSDRVLDWVNSRKSFLGIETCVSSGVDVSLKSRLVPIPFGWVEGGADTFDYAYVNGHRTTGSINGPNRYYPAVHMRLGDPIATHQEHSEGLAIIKTDEFGEFQPIYELRFFAV